MNVQANPLDSFLIVLCGMAIRTEARRSLLRTQPNL
jgi:hypothetical protein